MLQMIDQCEFGIQIFRDRTFNITNNETLTDVQCQIILILHNTMIRYKINIMFTEKK